jgi:hypothetical protein
MIFISVLYFIIPFLLLDSLWILSNYKKYDRVIPLTKSTMYPGVEKSSFYFMMKFLQSWGGNYIFWDTSAEIRWFGIKGNANERHFSINEEIRIPDYIYTSRFNEDSLIQIKKMFEECNSDTLSLEHLTRMTNSINQKLSVYTLSVKKEHPFLFYISSRIIYMKKYLFHSGTYNIFKFPWSRLNYFKRIIKIFYSAEYIFILIAGFAGIFLLMQKPISIYKLLLPIVSLYGIIIFPVILRLPEIRYFAPSFPFLLVCSMYFADYLLIKFRNNN